jgi:hypothetical protein
MQKKLQKCLRESGRPQRDDQGKVVKVDGKNVNIPGRLNLLKGWESLLKNIILHRFR